MTSLSLVSVIIPTYNRAALLGRAIRSVQKQTYPHLEIIVVDDASSDSTYDTVANLADSRIRYVCHDANRGGSAARNTGIRAAIGEFIAFLDDDDEWVPYKVEEQLNALRGYDVVVCASYDPGEELPRYHAKETLDLEDLKHGPWGGTGVLMARAEVLKEITFDETLPRGQDWDLFIRIALRHKIRYLNKPLLRYNGGPHPRISNNVPTIPIAKLEQQFRSVHKHRELFGNRWHDRQMAAALLYGLRHRRDRMALIAYTARRYGVRNVVSALTRRVAVKLRSHVLFRTLPTYRRLERS